MEITKYITNVMELIDKNKELLPNDDYLNICNSLKNLYNDKENEIQQVKFIYQDKENIQSCEFDKDNAILVMIDYVDIGHNIYDNCFDENVDEDEEIENLLITPQVIKNKICYISKDDYELYCKSSRCKECLFHKANDGSEIDFLKLYESGLKFDTYNILEKQNKIRIQTNELISLSAIKKYI